MATTADTTSADGRRGTAASPSPGWRDRVVLIGFAVVFLSAFTQADRFLGRAGMLPIPPTVAFLLLMVPLACWAVARDLRGPNRGYGLLRLGAGSITLWGPLAALACLALLWSLHPTANWTEGGSYVFLLPYDFAVLVLSMLVGTLPEVHRNLRTLAAVAGAILVATVLGDVISPGSFSADPSRAAGLATNANVSAFLLISACCVALSYGRSRRRDLVLLAVGTVAVLLTFSRAGLLLFLVLVGCYSLTSRAPRGRRGGWPRWVPLTAALVILVLGLWTARQLVGLEVGIFGRTAAQKRVGMLSEPTEFVVDDDSRMGLVKLYADLISEAPVMGHGTGYSYLLTVGPHNRFLQSWTNLGLGGLLAYLGLLVGAFLLFATLRFRAGMAYVVILFCWSFFSHGVLEQRSVPMLLGLLASVALAPRAHQLAADGNDG